MTRHDEFKAKLAEGLRALPPSSVPHRQEWVSAFDFAAQMADVVWGGDGRYTCHACGFNIGDPPVLPCSKCGCQVGRERNESTDDLSRIRHALCIALGVNPALNEPTYDLLLRLIARGPKVVTFDPSVSTWHYRGFQTSGVVEPVTVTFNERPHDPALVSLLRQAEWAGVSLSGDAAVPACPWCDNDGSAGHATECPVAPILYPKES